STLDAPRKKVVACGKVFGGDDPPGEGSLPLAREEDLPLVDRPPTQIERGEFIETGHGIEPEARGQVGHLPREEGLEHGGQGGDGAGERGERRVERRALGRVLCLLPGS